MSDRQISRISLSGEREYLACESCGEIVDVPYDCAQFSLGNAPVRLGFATVATTR